MLIFENSIMRFSNIVWIKNLPQPIFNIFFLKNFIFPVNKKYLALHFGSFVKFKAAN